MKPVRAAITAEDILALTDPSETCDRLPPLETLSRDAFMQATIGIAFANRDGSYRYCNETFSLLLGFSAAELNRQSITSLTLVDDLEPTTAGLERLWAGKIDQLDVEKRCVHKDGSALWVRVTTSLIRHGEKPVCTVEFVRDISARKKMAAALLQSRTLLATAIAELPHALLACDANGVATNYNRAAIELFGIRIEDTTAAGAGADLIRSKIYRPGGTTPIPHEENPQACALRGEDVSDVEYVMVTPSGASRTTLSSARRLVGPAGEALGAVWMVQDITERRRAEQELDHVHKQLLVASRHAGMAEVATNVLHNVGNVLNSVNVSASVVSERIKKSKCVKLGQVAALLTEHARDLASFLTGPKGRHVPGYLQELAADLVSERDTAVSELTELRGNVEHIKEIVAMQQSYAKRGGLVETVDIRGLVEDSLRMNEGAFSRHGVRMSREYEDVPPIQVDRHKVLQILVNVIRNAKYACDEAQGDDKRVTVRIRSTNGSLLISIIDTGVGIPKENLERIFNHGFTTRADGHGFGLHSSALAAKEMGGTLHAESAGPGQGATFTLALPLVSPEYVDAK
jgi:PAS domain S-box-containing protein